MLPRLAGASTALDLLLSGRTLWAEEALRLGVVDRLSEEGKAAADAHFYAGELASLSSRPRWPSRSGTREYLNIDPCCAGAYAGC
jgi:enoyl-CoA hydratase/carnithine racemase